MSRRDRLASRAREKRKQPASTTARSQQEALLPAIARMAKDSVDVLERHLERERNDGDSGLLRFVQEQLRAGNMGRDGKCVQGQSGALVHAFREYIRPVVMGGLLNIDIDSPLDPGGAPNPFYRLPGEMRDHLMTVLVAELAEAYAELKFGVQSLAAIQRDIDEMHAEMEGRYLELRCLLREAAAEQLAKMEERGLVPAKDVPSIAAIARHKEGEEWRRMRASLVRAIRSANPVDEVIGNLIDKELREGGEEPDPAVVAVLAREYEWTLAELIMDRWVAQETADAVFDAGSYRSFKSRGQIWGDQELTRLGLAIWNDTYGKGGGDAAGVVAGAWLRTASERGVSASPERGHVVQSIAEWAGKWAVHAFQRVTTSHTYGSALMCSDVDPQHLADIEVQWHAFMVVLPNDLLGFEGSCYTRILVACLEGRSIMVLLNQAEAEASNRILVVVQPSLAALLDAHDEAEMRHTTDRLTEDRQGKVRRCVVMAKRLVAGLLLAMQHQDNFRTKQVRGAVQRRWREPGAEPEHRIVFVGKPIKVDCRGAIREYVEHGPRRKGRAPSVQVLVRGFFRRQVVGVGRTGRKVIWVEPFWRGPVDAPIFTRPKKVS